MWRLEIESWGVQNLREGMTLVEGLGFPQRKQGLLPGDHLGACPLAGAPRLSGLMGVLPDWRSRWAPPPTSSLGTPVTQCCLARSGIYPCRDLSSFLGRRSCPRPKQVAPVPNGASPLCSHYDFPFPPHRESPVGIGMKPHWSHGSI